MFLCSSANTDCLTHEVLTLARDRAIFVYKTETPLKG